MLFNSYIFILGYLPIVLAVYFLLGRLHHKASILFLGVASIVFYGWWSAEYIPLLMLSIIYNFIFGMLIFRASRQRFLLAPKQLFILGVLGNILLLCYYKYAGFFVGNVGAAFGVKFDIEAIVLPLGISFFTFTQISFLSDAYKGKAREYDFPRYLLFVSYFPHLIAGPILHHSQMMPQFADKENARFQLDNFSIGLCFFAVGIFKKVVIADSIAPYSDQIFNSATEVELTLYEAWLGTLAYTCQIYFDFSGYSDMAVGLARMMNIHLPYNFASPYQAKNIIEFWRCWHMTLSQFLRDYLYIPLGGNRHGDLRRYANLMITMLLGGLWHGAGWGFIVWGGLHGLYLFSNHLVSGWKLPLGPWFWRSVTFLCVAVAWVFFRAPTLESAVSMLRPMFFLNGLSLPERLMAPLEKFAGGGWLRFDGMFHNGLVNPAPALLAIAAALAIAFLAPNSQAIIDGAAAGQKAWLRSVVRSPVALGVILGAAFAISFALLGGETPFLYFQF